jgi:uncharacterized membrane protein YphA (DoxX/SURF4 family)
VEQGWAPLFRRAINDAQAGEQAMTTPDLTRPGRLAFVAGLTGLGVLSLIFGDLAQGLQPPLVLLGSSAILAYVTGGLLTLAALSMPASGAIARQGGLVVAAYWLAWIVLGHTFAVLANPADPVAWVALSEAAGMVAAALLLSRLEDGEPTPRLRLGARLVVGLMLVWFGVVHLMFRGAIAGMIPHWMPARDLWPWLTGAANIAAGLGVITGVAGRLAAALCGVMFASWIFLVHLPRLLAEPHSRFEWTALALNLCLVGIVWVTSGAALRRAP